mgnify:CR=1 FL=1
MNKIILTGVLLLLSSSVFPEASIDNQHQDQTYLLVAPGTVTGKSGQAENHSPRVLPTTPNERTHFRQQPGRYKYVGEGKKFRQFGQKPGQNNPWFEDYNMGYPRNMSPSRSHPITNPWQLGGMPPLHDLQMEGQQSFSTGGVSQYGSGNYSGSNNYYPDFPDGIYRDTNPAAHSLPGRNNGFMPGLGGDNFNFPFTPFGMF